MDNATIAAIIAAANNGNDVNRISPDDLREILLRITDKKISELGDKVNECQKKHDKHRQNFMFFLVFICASICFPHFMYLILCVLVGSLIREQLSEMKEAKNNLNKALNNFSKAHDDKAELNDFFDKYLK